MQKIHKAKKSLGLKKFSQENFSPEQKYILNNHKAKKALGQNFLKSKIALDNIVLAGEISKKDIIVEIGPGKGALTEKLLEKTELLFAIEKDRDLIEFLKEKFAKEIKEKKLILLNEDILNIEIKKIINQNSEYKIIANIPYNITGAILKKFLTEEHQPIQMVLMVQHEVAKRIIANDKKESILSISVKAYGEPKMIMKVPARYFSPAPKVDSAVISIKNISRKTFLENKINEKKFWELIHAGFIHKRKKLSSNLNKFINKETKNNLKNIRAEDFSLKDWILLTKNQ